MRSHFSKGRAMKPLPHVIIFTFRLLLGLCAAVSVLLLSACGGDSQYIKPSPQAFSDIPTTFYQDKPYSDGVRNKLDLLVPQCNGFCPVVVFVHGGKFTEGDKSEAYEGARTSRWVSATRALLEKGIAVASVNYTYLDITGNEDQGLERQMREITRAVQTLKHDGLGMGILAHRMMLAGHSAGAGAAFWVAFSDDQMDPGGDSVAQTSSSVLGVFALEGQSTYDIIRWNDDVMPGDNVVNDVLYGTSLEDTRVLMEAAYNLESLTEWSDLHGPGVASYRRSLDMLALLTSGDPEFWIDNSTVVGTFGQLRTPDALYHGGEHAEALHRRALEVGVDHTAVTATTGTVRYLYGGQQTRDNNPIEFAARILGVE